MTGLVKWWLWSEVSVTKSNRIYRRVPQELIVPLGVLNVVAVSRLLLQFRCGFRWTGNRGDSGPCRDSKT